MAKLDGELKIASTWLRENKLSLNLLKIKVMFFGTPNKLTAKTMTFQDNVLDVVDKFK